MCDNINETGVGRVCDRGKYSLRGMAQEILQARLRDVQDALRAKGMTPEQCHMAAIATVVAKPDWWGPGADQPGKSVALLNRYRADIVAVLQKETTGNDKSTWFNGEVTWEDLLAAVQQEWTPADLSGANGEGRRFHAELALSGLRLAIAHHTAERVILEGDKCPLHD